MLFEKVWEAHAGAHLAGVYCRDVAVVTPARFERAALRLGI